MKVAEELDVRYLHLRKIELIDGRYNIGKQFAPCGGITLAYRFEGNAVVAAAARCHPRDRYVRKEGARIARDRLLAFLPDARVTLPMPATFKVCTVPPELTALFKDVPEVVEALQAIGKKWRESLVRRALLEYATRQPSWQQGLRSTLRYGSLVCDKVLNDA